MNPVPAAGDENVFVAAIQLALPRASTAVMVVRKMAVCIVSMMGCQPRWPAGCSPNLLLAISGIWLNFGSTGQSVDHCIGRLLVSKVCRRRSMVELVDVMFGDGVTKILGLIASLVLIITVQREPQAGAKIDVQRQSKVLTCASAEYLHRQLYIEMLASAPAILYCCFMYILSARSLGDNAILAGRLSVVS